MTKSIKKAIIKKELIMNILRWICVLPAFLLAYCLSYFFFNFGISFGMTRLNISEILYDMKVFGGFGGHYFLGPICLFLMEITSTATAISAATFVSPTYKKITFFFLSGVMLTLASINAYFTFKYLSLNKRYTEFIAAEILCFISRLGGIIISYPMTMERFDEK